MKLKSLFAVALVGALHVAACTKQETPAPRAPQESGKPTTEEPEGDHTSANPRNDVDNSPDADTAHSDQNPIPQGPARASEK